MRYLALISIACLASFNAGPGFSQDTKDRAVDQYTCRDVVRDSGTDRDVAIAFLHGFLLGKSGVSKFNLDTLRKQSDDFIERCLNNLAERAVDAMAEVKK